MKFFVGLFLGIFVIVNAQECGKLGNVNIEDKNAKLPWTVQLRERMSNEVVCQGTLVSNQHALIASHCLWPKPYYKNLKVSSNLYVTIGNKPYDLVDVKIHEDWSFNKPSYDADIAIISLFNPVPSSNDVNPICLLPHNSGDLIRPNGVVAGMNAADESSVRERVAVEKNEACFKNFASNTNKASTRTFCAKWPGQNLEISNDLSGTYLYDDNNSWYIQGIESQSFVQKDQCDVSKHSVFTNVAHYVDWIQKIVKRDTERQWKDTELKCTFVKNYEGLYGCEVENLVINSPSVRIASVSGQHEDRKTNNDVDYVWIRNSRTTHLPRFDAGIFFPNLVKYLVTNSGLKFVDRDDFSGMPQLETLDLSQNELEELPEDAFYDLNELVDFFADNNQLKTVPGKLLSRASMFQRFKASNNTIESLPADLFKNNPSLKIVSLDNNRLRRIQTDFRPFRNLKKIDLLNNPCVNTNFNDWRKYKTVVIVQKEIESSCK